MAAINVDKLSLKELVNLDAMIKSALGVARDSERKLLKQKMADLAATHGLTISDLFDGARGRKKPIGVARYANPENKSDTWTGRGRKPNWVLARLKKGAKLSDFEI